MVDAWRRQPPQHAARDRDQALRWLQAIGGTSNVTDDAVVVSVESAIRGTVSRRVAIDTGIEREEAVRLALVRACEELRLALG